jgi:hypothetical protein
MEAQNPINIEKLIPSSLLEEEYFDQENISSEIYNEDISSSRIKNNKKVTYIFFITFESAIG